jgi:uncharacterized protein YprB with RNaseH-like and TPR domain
MGVKKCVCKKWNDNLNALVDFCLSREKDTTVAICQMHATQNGKYISGEVLDIEIQNNIKRVSTFNGGEFGFSFIVDSNHQNALSYSNRDLLSLFKAHKFAYWIELPEVVL